MRCASAARQVDAAAAGHRAAHRGRGRGRATRSGRTCRRRVAGRLQDRRHREADAGVSRAERPGRRLHGDRRPVPQRRHACGSPISSGPASSANWRCGSARDLPPGPCTPAQAAAAVGELFAGIEIVENRYGDLLELGVADADRRSGVPRPRRCSASQARRTGARSTSATLRGRLIIDGAPARRGRRRRPDGRSDELPGLAGGVSVAEAFGGLKAGQVVMLGSVTPPIWLTGPASVTVDFSPCRRCR